MQQYLFLFCLAKWPQQFTVAPTAIPFTGHGLHNAERSACWSATQMAEESRPLTDHMIEVSSFTDCNDIESTLIVFIRLLRHPAILDRASWPFTQVIISWAANPKYPLPHGSAPCPIITVTGSFPLERLRHCEVTGQWRGDQDSNGRSERLSKSALPLGQPGIVAEEP